MILQFNLPFHIFNEDHRNIKTNYPLVSITYTDKTRNQGEYYLDLGKKIG